MTCGRSLGAGWDGCSRLGRALAVAIGVPILLLGCEGPAFDGHGRTSDEESLRSQRGGLPAEAFAASAIPERGELALDAERASSFVKLSLRCAEREYPNKPSNILAGDDTVLPPRELTPTFFGCFDWHSAVHGHWAMVRVLKRFPSLDEAADIRAVLDRHLTTDRLERELRYFRLKRNRTFERPYGWGWLLRLAAELHQWDDPDGQRWSGRLAPLARFLAERAMDFLPRLSAPIRAGTHANTAFAMVHMLDYARAVGHAELAAVIEQRARDFHLRDRQCPTHYEPSGEDFISPCFAEADLMRRVLPAREFILWFDRFLPPVTSGRLAPVLMPVEVKDPEDPRIGHLIGLALHRAWAMRGVAASLPTQDPRRDLLLRSARNHRYEALRQMFDSGYGGEHWLASFAIYLLTDVGLAGS